MRLARAVASIALAALVVAGCSAGPPNRPSTGGNFADATCADLASWASTIQRAYRNLQDVQRFDPDNPTTSAQQQLRQLSQSLSDADRATQRLSDGISGRKAPEIENGEEVKKTIVDALKELREIGKTVRTSVDDYDVATATPEQAAKLKGDLQAMATGVETSLAQLTPLVSTNQQLRDALANSATCQRAASDLFSSS